MMFPTLSGMVSEPLKAFTVAEADTVTPQQLVDAVYGAAAMGYVGGVFRAKKAVAKNLGPAAETKLKDALIAGFI